MLTTNQKGAIAETAIAHEAIKLGIGVYHSYADERFDFIFDLRPRLVRVQCKSAPREGDVIVARLYSARRTATGLVRRIYNAGEIDAFALYCPDTEKCYFLDVKDFESRNCVFLRLDPTRNNQASGVNWAREYEFGATLKHLVGP
jgi:hypothetical protein